MPALDRITRDPNVMGGMPASMPEPSAIRSLVWTASPAPAWLAWIGRACFFAVFLTCVAAGTWAAVSLFRRGDPVFAALAAFATCGALPLPLVLFHNSRGRRGRITIDADSRTVTFEHVPVSRGFLPRPPVDRLECSFEEIYAVQISKSRVQQWIHIHTAAGRVVIPSDVDVVPLRDALESIAAQPGNERPRISLLEHVYFPTYAGAAIALVLLVIAMASGWLY